MLCLRQCLQFQWRLLDYHNKKSRVSVTTFSFCFACHPFRIHKDFQKQTNMCLVEHLPEVLEPAVEKIIKAA